MELLSLISGKGFVMYSKLIAREVSTNAAILYGQLASSYESFGSKNMLIHIEGDDYFFLTADVIQEETSLTYRQQTKAIKELESFGLITTVIRGVPAKKHFHLTSKIQEMICNPSSDKMSDLQRIDNNRSESPSYDKRAKLEYTNEQGKYVQKGSSIKKNKKEKNEKEINTYVDNNLLTKQKTIDSLIFEFMKKGLSKEVCLRVLNEVNLNPDIQNFGGYFKAALQNALDNSMVRNGSLRKKDLLIKRAQKRGVPIYDWLEDQE
ncbi:hypothetical protein [Sporosarcina koreensis]|uniref:hypothetical protein n=1 Tax=Sporosarcina koreensis TaxID=334735 RepID=UPI0006935070|nr:hypothetical protein [Sporosarcina koreensis]